MRNEGKSEDDSDVDNDLSEQIIEQDKSGEEVNIQGQKSHVDSDASEEAGEEENVGQDSDDNDSSEEENSGNTENVEDQSEEVTQEQNQGYEVELRVIVEIADDTDDSLVPVLDDHDEAERKLLDWVT